jgi:hypothetical protein
LETILKSFKKFNIIFLVLLVGCAAAPQKSLKVIDLPPLDSSYSRVYITSGMSQARIRSAYLAGPVFFNGKKIGTTANYEYFVVDIKPGEYKITCEPSKTYKNLAEEKLITFIANEPTYLACDQYPMGARAFGSASFGLLGLMAEAASTYESKTYLSVQNKESAIYHSRDTVILSGDVVEYTKITDL